MITLRKILEETLGRKATTEEYQIAKRCTFAILYGKYVAALEDCHDDLVRVIKLGIAEDAAFRHLRGKGQGPSEEVAK